MNRLAFKVILLFGLFSMPAMSSSQILPNPAMDSVQVNAPTENLDPLGRSNPRGTLKGFFRSISNEDYLLGSQYLNMPANFDTGNDSLVRLLVQKLENALNQAGTIVPINIVNNSPDGDLNDDLDPLIEEVGAISTKEQEFPVFLERITNDKNDQLWLFSQETLEILSKDIYAEEQVFLIEPASKGMLSTRWKGARLADWLGNVLLAIGAYLMAWLITLLLSWMVRTWWRDFEKSKHRSVLITLLIPLRLVLAVILFLFLSRSIGISIIVRQAFSVVNIIALWIALFIFIWLLINTLSTLGEQKLREKNSFAGLSAISFFRNSAKFILVVIALLILLDTVGANVTAGLAALGIGGIALALGAQKTIENIVGGLSVVFDQPVAVGDFCKFGDTLGTVERIGMRSTRIRTINRTVVTIPNADFSSRSIENYSKRDLFLYHSKIGLRYETSSDQMRFILVELRKLLYAHPKVDRDPARVRFLGYGNDSLQVEIFAYTHAKDWNDFLGIQEDIHLRLAKVIEDSGSGFAFPSQTVYLSKDSGLSGSKKEEAEKKVRQWIENDELSLPEFDPKTIQSLKGSLEYPLKGSDTSKDENR